ncbi:LTA synthase family protein [Fredinandcohnia sp. 179-A 10B2 NHS]|uniref:LTA synthase family protein n=1 Tax=Fredinandcohnia sp. 179-A 10B2 NHS TaxID=3235176 RepID=UPI0039A11438
MKKCNIKHSPLLLFGLLVLLFSIKTYIAYNVEFNLDIKNDIQKFLLAINPISSAIFFLAIAFLFTGKRRHVAFVTIHFLLSFVLFANIMYYRFFTDFITLPVLMQTKNFGDLGGSTLALFEAYDILYFIDVIIGIVIILSGAFSLKGTIRKRTVASVFVSAILLFMGNLHLAEEDRPELLTRSFDRNYLVKYLGMYNYHIYDAIQTAKSSSQRVLADSDDITEIENYTKANFSQRNEELFGQAKGMNVVYLELESFQTFVLDYKLHGEEVTPFLNSLTRDESTFYFPNFFHQTAQGKTSDSEFILDNSIYGLPQGAVFMTKAQNTYQAFPAILKGNGYESASFHGNYKTFWNRENMYKAFGYEHFFDAEYYEMTPENTINYGLNDKPFFEQSMPLLNSLPEPFFAKFITLTNHHPFVLKEEDVTLAPGDFGSKTVNQYFQTARYMDEAIEEFFGYLKESGLYDNTMVVLYGDHYGISENHNKAMAKVLGKEITPFENAQLQRVPLFIHIPAAEGKQVETYGGQIDVRPTILHLLGIETEEYIEFGSDLFSDERKQIVPFRNGDFVKKDYTYVKGVCYDNASAQEVEKDSCHASNEYVKSTLAISDKLVYGDLLRFYHPTGFTPVERSQLDYSIRNTAIDSLEQQTERNE